MCDLHNSTFHRCPVSNCSCRFILGIEIKLRNEKNTVTSHLTSHRDIHSLLFCAFSCVKLELVKLQYHIYLYCHLLSNMRNSDFYKYLNFWLISIP